MTNKSHNVNWWEFLLFLILFFSMLFWKTQGAVYSILKNILCFLVITYIYTKENLLNMPVKKSCILYVKVFLHIILYFYLTNFLYKSIFLFLPNILKNTFTDIYSEQVANYISSLLLLLILYCIATLNNKIKDSIIKKISHRKNPVFISLKIFVNQIFSLPWKTLIYTLYLFSQLSELELVEITDKASSMFVTTNKTSIVILIALDRIVSTWRNEKQRYQDYCNMAFKD